VRNAIGRIVATIRSRPYLTIAATIELQVMTILGFGGLGGWIYWPPPSMLAYSEIIALTGIASAWGAWARVFVSLLPALPWALSLPAWVRVLSTLPVVVTAWMLAYGFHATGQGFGAFGWGTIGAWGLVAVGIRARVRQLDLDAAALAKGAACDPY